MTSVSIIIPSYRQPQFLGRAIESCLDQDHDDLEVIVIDDRSRDASLGLALSWSLRDDRVRVIELDENGGLGKARNAGIAQATGEYLCFLDSDDYLLPGSISARLEAIPGATERYGDALAGVYGDWQHVAESVDYPAVRSPRAKMPVVSAANYTGENVFICSAPLVRRQRVLEAGGFPEGLAMLEDFGLWARMIAGGSVFAPVHHVVATYRQRPNSMLRGDGVVVMADHVAIINDWVLSQDVLLADGGAMAGWLAGETPYSYGRMSWNVPSVLGNFGGAAGAASVLSTTRHVREPDNTLPDFMDSPTSTGLADTTIPLSVDNSEPEVAIVVHSLEHALEAVAVVGELQSTTNVAVLAHDPADWAMLWPLALAGIVTRSATSLEVPGLVMVDLAADDNEFANSSSLAAVGAQRLWPNIGPRRRRGLVYVPDILSGHPGLDAWVSTALHTLAEADLDPEIIADPQVRNDLGGWRSSLFAIDDLLGSAVLVCPAGDHVALVDQLVPLAIFDPFLGGAGGARTGSELATVVRTAIVGQAAGA